MILADDLGYGSLNYYDGADEAQVLRDSITASFRQTH